MAAPDERAERAGRNLRTARDRKGMSQSDVAAEMRAAGFTGWMQSTVQKAETAQRKIAAEEFQQLAEILGTTMERLFWLQGEDAEVAMTDAATIRLRQAWQEESDATLRLAAMLAAARHQLERARASKYKNVHAAARDLEAEIAASSVESAVGDGLARHEDGDT